MFIDGIIILVIIKFSGFFCVFKVYINNLKSNICVNVWIIWFFKVFLKFREDLNEI